MYLYFNALKFYDYRGKLANLKKLFSLKIKKFKVRRYYLLKRKRVKIAQEKLFQIYNNKYPDFESYKVYSLRLFGAALLFLINITGFRSSSLFDFSYFKVLVLAIHLKIFLY